MNGAARSLSLVRWVLPVAASWAAFGAATAAFGIVPCDAERQEEPALAAVEQLLEQAYPDTEPGAAVIATRGGEVVFRGGRGLASMELQVPIEPDTAFCLASVTKLFTAVATLQLVESEDLDLYETAQSFLPQLAHAEDVEVEHLLTHTSGIPDLAELPRYFERHLHEEVTPDELIEYVADEPLQFQPGTRYSYSNSNYAILARIVELASDMSWEDFLRERQFEPAGMESTRAGGHRRIVPGAANGYVLDDDGWRRSSFLSFTQGFGLGGLFSTVEDLARWQRALVAGELVSLDTLEEAWTPYPLEDGSSGRCGHGFMVPTDAGIRLVHHGGGIDGWRCHVLLLPDDDIFVAVLTNREAEGNDPQRVTSRIARLLQTGG